MILVLTGVSQDTEILHPIENNVVGTTYYLIFNHGEARIPVTSGAAQSATELLRKGSEALDISMSSRAQKDPEEEAEYFSASDYEDEDDVDEDDEDGVAQL